MSGRWGSCKVWDVCGNIHARTASITAPCSALPCRLITRHVNSYLSWQQLLRPLSHKRPFSAWKRDIGSVDVCSRSALPSVLETAVRLFGFPPRLLRLRTLQSVIQFKFLYRSACTNDNMGDAPAQSMNSNTGVMLTMAGLTCRLSYQLHARNYSSVINNGCYSQKYNS